MRTPRRLILGTAATATVVLAVAPPSPGDDGSAKAPYGFACNPEFIESDKDGDGYEVPADCDDENAAVHPDAQEVCNLIDDNCNGLVDEYTSRANPFAVVGRRDASPQQYVFDNTWDIPDGPEMMIDLSSGDEIAGLLMTDLELDGITDVVLQSMDELWVRAYTPDCDGGFDRRDLFDTVGDYRVRGVGDIDGDGDPDLVTLNALTWMGAVWNNDGDGAFTLHSSEVDWGIVGDSMEDADLADSQLLLDVTGDGFDDWLMCLGRYGQTYCYLAEGRTDGSMTTPSHLLTMTAVQSNSVTLGYFSQDEYPDLIFGLHQEIADATDENECRVYKLGGLESGGFETSPDYLFDLADEVQGTAWGYDPDGVLDGWLRTVDWDRSDAGRSEILVVLNAFEETNGYSLLYIKEPLDVDPTPGAQNREIRPLVKELVDITSSSDPHRYSVIAAGFPPE